MRMKPNPLQERVGTAEISRTEPVVAGSFVDFTITYTAGYFGIDDTGSVKICTRFATDMGRPQFTAPDQPNYVSIVASNGATLEYRYDVKGYVRPWDKTLYIKVVKGFFREGDQLIVHFGDPGGGCPGIRMQTFCEETFELKVLVDAIATYTYLEVPNSPVLRIVPGPAAVWKAQLPTMRRVGEPFRLLLKAEDRWGNPTDQVQARLHLASSLPIAGLPEEVTLSPHSGGARWVENLTVSSPGDLIVTAHDEQGKVVVQSNPLRIVDQATLVPYWGELHGQSEETIGTNSARAYFTFARDKSGVDVIVHQGNDFQITTPFWQELQRLTREFLDEGRFVTFPGYEWSGNTGLGGDRNVLYLEEGGPLHRSSHALVSDLRDLDTDCNSSEELFAALAGTQSVVFAHVGGRYADVRSHSTRLERSVEIHSAWGTFEWLLYDALRLGYRVGIVSNSDGHKGRPGASYPGASLFGAYGGLTCLLARALTREAIWEALLQRHHYGTTGNRMYMDVHARFAHPARRFLEDPQLGPAATETTQQAMMGDIVQTADPEVTLTLDLIASAPIEKVELRNGLEVLETVRPYGLADLGRRLRVIWSGAEYRGRGRETSWDGQATFAGNTVQAGRAINFYNLDKTLRQTSPTTLEWEALTTGGLGGFDCVVTDPHAGTLTVQTPLVQFCIPIAAIGLDETVYEAGGLARQIRVSRLPDVNPHTHLRLERTISLRATGDNPLYICVTQEDGHLAWSSPLYVFH
jgi:Protein of unknown function (DUF3604)